MDEFQRRPIEKLLDNVSDEEFWGYVSIVMKGDEGDDHMLVSDHETDM